MDNPAMRKRTGAQRSGAPTQRQLRVGEALRHALVDILDRAHFHDPDLAAVSITVTEVRVGPDLKNATAYVTPLGGADMDRTVAALNRAAGYVRRELGRVVTLRHVPQVAFAPDTSFDYSRQIDELLSRPEVARDLEDEGQDPEGNGNRDGA